MLLKLKKGCFIFYFKKKYIYSNKTTKYGNFKNHGSNACAFYGTWQSYECYRRK